MQFQSTSENTQSCIQYVYTILYIYIDVDIERERERDMYSLVIRHIPDLWLFHHAYSH